MAAAVKVRFGVKDIIGDLAGIGLNVQGMARALVKAGIERALNHRAAYAFAASVAKSLETVITDAPGGLEAKQRLAGALVVNAQLTAGQIGESFSKLAAAQLALEAARGTKDEEAMRSARELAEADLEQAIAALGKLAG